MCFSLCFHTIYVIIQCSCTYALAYSCTMTHNAMLQTQALHTWMGLKEYVYILHDLFVMGRYTFAAKITYYLKPYKIRVPRAH